MTHPCCTMVAGTCVMYHNQSKSMNNLQNDTLLLRYGSWYLCNVLQSDKPMNNLQNDTSVLHYGRWYLCNVVIDTLVLITTRCWLCRIVDIKEYSIACQHMYLIRVHSAVSTQKCHYIASKNKYHANEVLRCGFMSHRYYGMTLLRVFSNLFICSLFVPSCACYCIHVLETTTMLMHSCTWNNNNVTPFM